jgi:hypothetical protein
VAACATDHRRFPLRDPTWRDEDQRLQSKVPEEYFSPLVWDGAKYTIFHPITRFFAVDPGGEATNVNAVDEVPDSSWFINRLGRTEMTPEEIVRGPCEGPPLDSEGWTVIGAKLDGQTPGFRISARDGRQYLLKFDDDVQPERATAADVIGSKFFHAAGYNVPCNQIVSFGELALQVPPAAEHAKLPITPEKVHDILQFAPKGSDGQYRAMATEIVPGKIIGPWTYEDTRDDDINDVVPHQDRRELRAGYVLAAWLNHFDSRDGNTLASFEQTPDGRGFVKHYIIDWGDTLGSLWPWDDLSRRLGYSYYFDFAHIGRDIVTLGTVPRSWEKLTWGPAGVTIGYYGDDSQFEPDEWHDGYPNPAFMRMTERDAAWMTRIVARFTDADIDAIVAEGHLSNPIAVREVSRMLKSRRAKILQRWLTRLSPLTEPTVTTHESRTDLCLRDLAVVAKVASTDGRQYSARALDESGKARALPVHSDEASQVCMELPNADSASENHPFYLVIEAEATSPGQDRASPVRVYLYQLGMNSFRVVGLERPESR